jgi:hypothetical protein
MIKEVSPAARVNHYATLCASCPANQHTSNQRTRIWGIALSRRSPVVRGHPDKQPTAVLQKGYIIEQRDAMIARTRA